MSQPARSFSGWFPATSSDLETPFSFFQGWVEVVFFIRTVIQRVILSPLVVSSLRSWRHDVRGGAIALVSIDFMELVLKGGWCSNLPGVFNKSMPWISPGNVTTRMKHFWVWKYHDLNNRLICKPVILGCFGVDPINALRLQETDF